MPGRAILISYAAVDPHLQLFEVSPTHSDSIKGILATFLFPQWEQLADFISRLYLLHHLSGEISGNIIEDSLF